MLTPPCMRCVCIHWLIAECLSKSQLIFACSKKKSFTTCGKRLGVETGNKAMSTPRISYTSSQLCYMHGIHLVSGGLGMSYSPIFPQRGRIYSGHGRPGYEVIPTTKLVSKC